MKKEPEKNVPQFLTFFLGVFQKTAAVGLNKLTIGPSTMIRVEASKTNDDSSSDEELDEGPQTVLIGEGSDLQNQLEIEKLRQQAMSMNTGATMKAPGASLGAIQKVRTKKPKKTPQANPKKTKKKNQQKQKRKKRKKKRMKISKEKLEKL